MVSATNDSIYHPDMQLHTMDSYLFGVDTIHIDTTFGTGVLLSFIDEIDSIFEYGDSVKIQVMVEPHYVAEFDDRHIGNAVIPIFDTIRFVAHIDTTIEVTSYEWPQYTIDTAVSVGVPDSIVFEYFGIVDSGTILHVNINAPADSEYYVTGSRTGVYSSFVDTIIEGVLYDFALREKTVNFTGGKSYRWSWRNYWKNNWR